MSPETSAIATFGWLCRAKALASQSFAADAEAWLAASGAPVQAQRIFAKSAVSAGNTTDSDLVDGISVSAWSDSLRTRSAFYRILSDGGFLRVPFHTRVGLATQCPDRRAGCRGSCNSR